MRLIHRLARMELLSNVRVAKFPRCFANILDEKLLLLAAVVLDLPINRRQTSVFVPVSLASFHSLNI